ncbi:hypothetical protein RHMOL_Rhmol13G0268200 [Rhododendron molle]|uniref:Uncharacterized protein n=1 Tax=Rhododendron molle TaxID=49168 RepID=A0ACC0LCD2_RHOML|nr:hypothetical protein RHMOL_Rhmol13G0268200 [Rhododendron molle]
MCGVEGCRGGHHVTLFQDWRKQKALEKLWLPEYFALDKKDWRKQKALEKLWLQNTKKTEEESREEAAKAYG